MADIHTIRGRRFALIGCCECGVEWLMPGQLNNHALEEGKDKTFYCPNGHGQSYIESRADIYRREAERLKQRLAERDDDVRRQRNRAKGLERSIAAHKGQVTKLKKRAKAGVCLCCNRTFQNLARHMKSKHVSMDPVADC